jgi:hypothetical protein
MRKPATNVLEPILWIDAGQGEAYGFVQISESLGSAVGDSRWLHFAQLAETPWRRENDSAASAAGIQ